MTDRDILRFILLELASIQGNQSAMMHVLRSFVVGNSPQLEDYLTRCIDDTKEAALRTVEFADRLKTPE